jgi:hypothetical protein
MKTAVLSCAVLSCFFSFAAAAPPKEDAKKKKEAKAEKGNARDMLAKYDADSDKKLDKTELSAALKSLKRNVVSTRNGSWKNFDADNDDKIDQKELDKLLDANAELPAEEPKPNDPKGKTPPKNGLSLRPMPS